ncbi:hypothetical protein PUMCH_001462 [Australozyma saopauloensis]|uniref:Regulator of V-ATPase in vacuolar membrane protein 2 n=1 Tax=Australozyma saopauloensis TaxID=291208 RepID=A0AAX4H6I0_9ASCO|nr:hypothetical protein PUMCH_001462 [[Candida] saopauloensis]
MTVYLEVQAHSRHKELHWLVEEIVKPMFPRLIETLHLCSNLLLYNSPEHPDPNSHIKRGPSITLAVSSGKLEELKGILVRDGAHVTKINVVLKEKHFNRLVNRVQLAKPFLLPQIIQAKRSIDNAVELIVRALSLLDAPPGERGDTASSCNLDVESETAADVKYAQQAHIMLMSVFTDLLHELQIAKNSLQLPTEPALVFPKHVTPAGMFEPDISSSVAVDVYISQAEVCVDLKDLHVVTEKPWCEIDETTGKSYADQVREQILRKKEVETEQDVRAADAGVLGLFKQLLRKPRYETQDYIARCVTFNKQVVIVNKKIEVLTADPILVSAFTKLDSVEHMVSSFLENIKKLI